MTSTSPRRTILSLTGLTMAAAVALTGLVISPADASTRVNEQVYRMSKSRMLDMCHSQKAQIFCTKTGRSCSCDNGQYVWVFQPPFNQDESHVIRMPSPRRTSMSTLEGGERGDRGGRGNRP